MSKAQLTKAEGYFTLPPESICYQNGLSLEAYKNLKTLEGLPIEQEYVEKLRRLGLLWEKFSS